MLTGPSEPGAVEVFEILVREHAGMLEAYLRSLMGPGAPVDDLFQETMLVAWRRLKDFDRSRPFGAWIRGIAQVLVLEHSRRSRSRPMTMHPDTLAELDRRYDGLSSSDGDTFEEKAGKLEGCLGKLPDVMREAIELIYTRNLTVTEAAKSAGSSVESVKKRIQRGRRLLAECLGER